MNVQVRKIGNSEGIILPKEVLDRHGLKSGDTLELTEENGQIYLRTSEDDFAEKMELARQFMDRYKVALKKLAE
ncbi:AbrB/MazE/SpoVT family DNA-binding domain-containing protein [Pararhizobium haloflavum]|uniref:AbrB/MazE/SpoVT family DNA-binding domain-containing protein n=1 Tax=Pararhizobium haloflavum TaxID=2037914 RepID=UPI000C1A16C5|nr:AbrB/MazE/SpoVT family DNA-binding domain-containing protein [Pararhizobium haloflavum]